LFGFLDLTLVGYSQWMLLWLIIVYEFPQYDMDLLIDEVALMTLLVDELT